MVQLYIMTDNIVSHRLHGFGYCVICGRKTVKMYNIANNKYK